MAAAKTHRIAPVLLVIAVSLLVVAQLAPPAAACPHCPTPKPSPPPPSPPPPKPTPVPCPPPPPSTPTTPPTPPYTPSPSPPSGNKKCPINTLKLLACVDALDGLVHAVVGGSSAAQACCPLLKGVADLDAALCLCTTIKAKALSVSLVLPIAIQVLVNECHKNVPASFQCP